MRKRICVDIVVLVEKLFFPSLAVLHTLFRNAYILGATVVQWVKLLPTTLVFRMSTSPSSDCFTSNPTPC